ncbi:MAG: Heavy-metal-associated domain [Planctomycetota bacterium]|jgi:copper chaperone CopZ
MRTTNAISVSFVASFVCLSFALAACNGECSAPPADGGLANAANTSAAAATAPVAFTIAVKGMHCEGCEGAICDKVGKIAGVTSVKASHVDEKVDVTAPAESRGDIVAAIKKLGYKIEE